MGGCEIGEIDWRVRHELDGVDGFYVSVLRNSGVVYEVAGAPDRTTTVYITEGQDTVVVERAVDEEASVRASNIKFAEPVGALLRFTPFSKKITFAPHEAGAMRAYEGEEIAISYNDSDNEVVFLPVLKRIRHYPRRD